VTLSFEAVELIYSREWHEWRVYGGGEYLIHKDPPILKPRERPLGGRVSGQQAAFLERQTDYRVDMKAWRA